MKKIDLKINCTTIFPEKFVVIIVEYCNSNFLKDKIIQLLTKFESIQIIEMDVSNFNQKILSSTSGISHQCVLHLIDKKSIKESAKLAANHNLLYHNCPNIFLGVNGDVLTKTIIQTFLGLDIGFLKWDENEFLRLFDRMIYRTFDDQPIEKSDFNDVFFKTDYNPETAKRVFKDAQFQSQFDQHGWVKIPLLDKDTILEIRNYFESIDHDVQNGFFTTTWSKSLDTRLAVNEFLKNIFQPKLNELLCDYHFSYGNFFVKNPSENGECFPHQDWSSVDEEKYTAMTMWCALEDMTSKNGNLKYMPKSFQLQNYQRGRHLPIYFERYQKWIQKYLMRDIPMKAGELLFFSQRMIHGSGNNYNSTIRLACGGVALPNNAPILHHVGAVDGQSTTVRVVDASNDLFSKYDTFDVMEDAFTLYKYDHIDSPMKFKELIKVMF